MTRRWRVPRRDGLALRLAAFLTVALLPLGLIALWQTREVQAGAEARASLSLLALTGQSAAGVQQAIERALGAAESLGAVADLLQDPATCSATLGRYLAEPARYAFVGVLPGEGPVTCSTAAEPFEIDDRADWDGILADPRPRVRLGPSSAVMGREVLVVLSPILGEGARASGYLGLSLPQERVALASAPAGAATPIRLVTFNRDGTVLASLDAGGASGVPADLARDLPVGMELGAEARGEARAFVGRDGSGRERLYTLMPLVPDVAYALAVWSPEQAARQAGGLVGAPLLFPLMMWATSLAVAFWAINRMVIRPVGSLGRRMRSFGTDRSLPDPAAGRDAAFEIREIDGAFRQMAEAILHDEARMEDAFRDRGALLREVHHRVKNNLQLISSIVSLQVRRAPDGPTRAILRRLQDRVLTLAAIYRSLYASADMGDVNAADVLRLTVEQQVRDHRGLPPPILELDEVHLDADKVVPVAFVAAEAVSNAICHGLAGVAVGGAAAGPIRIRFERSRDTATLTVLSPAGAAEGPPGGRAAGPKGPGPDGAGLGHFLMLAFAAQVGGVIESARADGAHRLSLTFPLAEEAEEGGA